MGASNSEGNTTKYYKLKGKTSDTDPTAYFGSTIKVGDKWGIGEKFNSFSGRLVAIDHSTYEYLGELKNKLQLKLKDADGSVNIVEAGFNSLIYSLLNCLANCQPENISMSLSLGKAKMIGGKEGKRFPAIWVKNNGEEVKWKYPVTELPKPEEIKAGNKTVKDDTKVVEFWLKVLNEEIKPKLKAEVKSNDPAPAVVDDMSF